MVLTNSGDMDTPQHGNDSTRKRIKNYFWGIPVFFRNSRKSLKSSELFLGPFPHIFDPFPLIQKLLNHLFFGIRRGVPRVFSEFEVKKPAFFNRWRICSALNILVNQILIITKRTLSQTKLFQWSCFVPPLPHLYYLINFEK